MNESQVRIGIVGTSWWADAMYLPALSRAENGTVVAVCGRDLRRTGQFAESWQIPATYTDYRQMLASGKLDALIVASDNNSHYPISMDALDAGLDVLCEKPLALNYAEAQAMADKAAEKEAITLVPFTYRFMPTTRYVKDLIDRGFLGQPYHLNLRYYSGFGRDAAYMWRFDLDKAGSGAWGDLGSHFLYLATWFFGEVDALCTSLETHASRPELDPEGNRYRPADDSAMVLLRFKNGAQGFVHASTLAHEENEFGQVHEMDFHGSEGTLRHRIDWNRQQEVTGAKAGQGPTSQTLNIPDEYWGGVRRENVIETYKDTFRNEGRMVRDFVDAVATRNAVQPDFQAGADIQRLLDAGLKSAAQERWVRVSEISG